MTSTTNENFYLTVPKTAPLNVIRQVDAYGFISRNDTEEWIAECNLEVAAYLSCVYQYAYQEALDSDRFDDHELLDQILELLVNDPALREQAVDLDDTVESLIGNLTEEAILAHPRISANVSKLVDFEFWAIPSPEGRAVRWQTWAKNLQSSKLDVTSFSEELDNFNVEDTTGTELKDAAPFLDALAAWLDTENADYEDLVYHATFSNVFLSALMSRLSALGFVKIIDNVPSASYREIIEDSGIVKNTELLSQILTTSVEYGLGNYSLSDEDLAVLFLNAGAHPDIVAGLRIDCLGINLDDDLVRAINQFLSHTLADNTELWSTAMSLLDGYEGTYEELIEKTKAIHLSD